MKIPPNAKRVFQGKIFDVYQWKQKMFDGSVETFEMLKRPDTVQVMAVKGDKILLARQEQPDKARFYSFFGGRADRGEKPLAAAKRELREESGLVSRDWMLWKIYQPYSKIDWKIYYYLARNCQKTAEPALDAGEKIKVVELDFRQFVKLATSEEFAACQFSRDLLRLRLAPKKLKEFRQKLFGK